MVSQFWTFKSGISSYGIPRNIAFRYDRVYEGKVTSLHASARMHPLATEHLPYLINFFASWPSSVTKMTRWSPRAVTTFYPFYFYLPILRSIPCGNHMSASGRPAANQSNHPHAGKGVNWHLLSHSSTCMCRYVHTFISVSFFLSVSDWWFDMVHISG